MAQIFENQVAIVTGAGSADGIGFAVARRLLAGGAKVAITSTTSRIVERARELDASFPLLRTSPSRPKLKRWLEPWRRGKAGPISS